LTLPSKADYQRFYDNIRGGWSEKIITLRRDILIREFLKKHNVPELDDKRQISDEEKIAIFADRSRCEMRGCGKTFSDYKEAEYHHIEPYSEGGKTKRANIMVLCRDCHDLVHREEKTECSAEDTLTQDGH
jgi:5-methylcytosine-specific restriction endonuclease McrA